MEPELDVGKLCDRFRPIYLAAVSDALDRFGCKHQFLGSAIKPLKPDMKVIGPAFTVVGTAGSSPHYEAEMEKITSFCEKTSALDVWVVEGGGGDGLIQWGELLTTACMSRKVAGAVVNGGTRDSVYISNLNFPLFVSYTSPLHPMGRWVYQQCQEPLFINGVAISPGDFVIGDMDGVVIVPRDLVYKVLLEAEEIVRVEAKVREGLGRGAKFIDMYKTYKTPF